MTDDSLLPFDLPAVQRKKVTAAFDGGLISSDGGLVLLREAERSLGLAETMAGCRRGARPRRRGRAVPAGRAERARAGQRARPGRWRPRR